MNQFSLDEVASGSRRGTAPAVLPSIAPAWTLRRVFASTVCRTACRFLAADKPFREVPCGNRSFAVFQAHLPAPCCRQSRENFGSRRLVRWADDLDRPCSSMIRCGYRSFLGADPAGMHDLIDLCDDVLRLILYSPLIRRC